MTDLPHEELTPTQKVWAWIGAVVAGWLLLTAIVWPLMWLFR